MYRLKGDKQLDKMPPPPPPPPLPTSPFGHLSRFKSTLFTKTDCDYLKG